MAMNGGTDRERQFITALNAYYNTPDGSPATGRLDNHVMGRWDRAIAWSRMKKRCGNLAINIPTILKRRPFMPSRSWRSVTPHPTDTTLSNQLQAAAILEKLWKKNPQHPGRRSLFDP